LPGQGRLSSFSKNKGTGRDLREHFNKLVYEQTRDDLLARLEVSQGTATGLMFGELLSFLHGRISERKTGAEAAQPHVILSVEQMEMPTIPRLLREPEDMRVLEGMLASLNTDIWTASTATCPVALLRHERGYPEEMGAIAAFIDEALDLPPRAAWIGRSAPRGGPVMR